jgi:hypothetical protein
MDESQRGDLPRLELDGIYQWLKNKDQIRFFGVVTRHAGRGGT